MVSPRRRGQNLERCSNTLTRIHSLSKYTLTIQREPSCVDSRCSHSSFSPAPAACAIHPAYTDADIVFDERLIGTWGDEPGGSLVVTRHGQEDSYDLAYASHNKTTALRATLTKLGPDVLADVTLDESRLPEDDTYRSFVLPLHMFYVVKVDAQALTLRGFDTKAVADYLKAHPDAIAHEHGKAQTADDRDVLLTADTPALRAFLTKMISTEGMLSDADTMRRIETSPATKPN